MKYLCLIYEDETRWQNMPRAELDKVYAEYSAFKDDINNSGHLIGCNPLQPTNAATTVRVWDGKVSTTDGPFAETKEAPRRLLSYRGQGPQRRHSSGLEDSVGAHWKYRGAAGLGDHLALSAAGACRRGRRQEHPKILSRAEWLTTRKRGCAKPGTPDRETSTLTRNAETKFAHNNSD